MRWQTLDSITRSVLLQKGYPIHYYVDFLKFACDGLREIHFDSLRSVNSVKLPVNSYKAVTLPCEFADFVRVGVKIGQYVKKLTQYNINRLNNYGTDGITKIPYDDTLPDDTQFVDGAIAVTGTGVSFNEHGEQRGAIFGFNPGRSGGHFSLIRERNEIQLDNDFPYNFIIVDYITDGQETDSATQIHPYAQAAIEAYVIWKMKANNRSYSAGEVQMAEISFNKQHALVRARMNPLTCSDIIMSFRRGYTGLYRN